MQLNFNLSSKKESLGNKIIPTNNYISKIGDMIDFQNYLIEIKKPELDFSFKVQAIQYEFYTDEEGVEHIGQLIDCVPISEWVVPE